MKRLVILFFTLPAFTQAQFIYSIESTPDSASVRINGEEECRTPCDLTFYWKSYKDKNLQIEVFEEGYIPWKDSITSKPMKFSFAANIDLEREYPKFEFDTLTAPIAFDKLLADEFLDGELIGHIQFENGQREDIKWEGSVKTGAPEFEKVFYKAVEKSGFQTPNSIQTRIQLFKPTETVAPPPPRFIIGLKLDHIYYTIEELTRNKQREFKSRVTMNCEWQVLDKATNEVVISYKNKGVYRTRSKYSLDNIQNLPPFENALLDFLENSDLYTLVKDSEPTIKTYSSVSANPEKIHPIEAAYIPEFESFSDMIKYASTSCVTVVTDNSFGSGAIINNEGLLLTAYHVIEDAHSLEVKFSNGLQLEAEVVTYNIENDIALLDITGSGYQALPLNSTEIGLGEDLLTIGTPTSIELGQSLSKGIVSGRRMMEETSVLQLDMSVSPGNSGGPLLNLKGEIVGIVQSKIVGEGIEGIGFGISASEVISSLNLKITE